MNIIDRYIINTILISSVMVAMVVVALSAFITFVDIVDDIGRGQFVIYNAFHYALLTLPTRVYDTFPFIALIGALLGLGAMNSNSEIIAIRASGLSVMRVLMAVMKAGMILAIFMFTLGEYIVPVTETIAQRTRSMALDNNITVDIQNEIWVREGKTFTNIRSIQSDNSLSDITIYTFNDDNSLKVTTVAQHANFIQNKWILEGIQQTFFSDQKIIVNELDKALWPTPLDMDLIDVIISELTHLSATGLYKYASYLEANALASDEYWLAFWNKVVAPFSLITMLLLSIPFVFDSTRSGNAGNRIFIGVLIGVGFTISNRIAAQSGLVYDIFPLLSASFMTIVTFILALFFIRRMT